MAGGDRGTEDNRAWGLGVTVRLCQGYSVPGPPSRKAAPKAFASGRRSGGNQVAVLARFTGVKTIAPGGAITPWH